VTLWLLIKRRCCFFVGNSSPLMRNVLLYAGRYFLERVLWSSIIYIASSIWPELKSFVQFVLVNSTWNIGNGENVHFWKDMWLGESLVQSLNILSHFHAQLDMKVSDYIVNQQWRIPTYISSKYPTLTVLIQNTTLNIEPQNDCVLASFHGWEFVQQVSLWFSESQSACVGLVQVYLECLCPSHSGLHFLEIGTS